MSDESFAPYTRNMKALPGWADSMDSSTDAIDTNLSFSTLLFSSSFDRPSSKLPHSLHRA
jgi:hypothetical protein